MLKVAWQSGSDQVRHMVVDKVLVEVVDLFAAFGFEVFDAANDLDGVTVLAAPNGQRGAPETVADSLGFGAQPFIFDPRKI